MEALDYIEAGVNRGRLVLSIYLDIKGAFDTIKPQALIKAMESRGMPGWYIRILKDFLSHHKTTLELAGYKETRMLNRGAPQGSVGAPTAWNVAFHELVKIINKDGIKGIAFADDGAIFITGSDPKEMRETMQKVLNETEEWASSFGLKFAPTKSYAILYNRKRIKPNLPEEMQIGGGKIPYVNEVWG